MSSRISQIEPLEERRLLSVSLNSVTHTLTVNGTNGNDTINVSLSNGKLTAQVNNAVKTVAASSVKKLVINALNGNDKVTVSADVKIPATINGGAGNDTLTGGGGNDHINGGGGNDLIDGGGGSDVISGGAGTDTATYAKRTAAVKVSLNNVADDGEGGEKDDVETDVEDVTGGSGNDTLVGDDAGNKLVGGAGDDDLEGKGGNDDLEGDAGNDIENGGSGNDDLDGGTGNDDLDGGAGQNRLRGGAGHDHFHHSGGTDDVEDESSDDQDDANEGQEFEGVLGAVNASAGTITVVGENGASQQFTVPVNTPVSINGVSGKTLADVAALPTGAGTEVDVSFTVDATTGVKTATSLKVRQENGGGGDTNDELEVSGSFQAATGSTITLKTKDGQLHTYTVDPSVTVIVNHATVPFSSLSTNTSLSGADTELKLSAGGATQAVVKIQIDTEND